MRHLAGGDCSRRPGAGHDGRSCRRDRQPRIQRYRKAPRMTCTTREPKDGIHDAFARAEGLNRPELTAMAQRAFARANEHREIYNRITEMPRRLSAIESTLGWQLAISYLDRTGREEFTQAEYSRWNKAGSCASGSRRRDWYSFSRFSRTQPSPTVSI